MRRLIQLALLAACAALVPPEASAIVADAAFRHCVYDAVPLDGAWEMAYLTNVWSSTAFPSFKGKLVAKAVPGYWEDMVQDFRAAGIKDDFRINPLYVRQTYPISFKAFDLTLPNIYGCFLYRRKVVLDRTGPCVISFEGVRNQVHLWVNGRFVAFRQGFSTPFELAVPEGTLRIGENEIVLAVSNNANIGCYGAEVSGLTTRGPFAATGGVCGRVELRLLKNALADVHVTTARDLKSFTVHARTGGGRPDGFRYEISDRSGNVLAKGEATGDFTLPSDGFVPWSPENPVRYVLRLTTPEGGCTLKFGVRRLAADGGRLLLNGRPVYLRGVTEHCYFPETVHLPRSLEYYRMIIGRRKELGFNFVRFHTYVPVDEYLEAADELGMLVHIESPNFVSVEEYEAIVAFARRHPSVVIYCTGNETRIDRKAEAYLREVSGIVHSRTDALFSPMSALRGVEYMLAKGKDDVSDTPFRHNPRRMERLAGYCDMFTTFQQGAVSYNSLNGPSAETIDSWAEAYRSKPLVSHEICIDGGYMNLDLEKEYPPGSPLTRTGFMSGMRDNLARRGLLGRAAGYHRCSSEWTRRIRKFTFEKMRACRRTCGYDFLGDINHHWHTFGYNVGMMDEFYRLKPGETVENVRRYNSAAVLLSDLGSDFNVLAGGSRRVVLSVSNYAADAPGGTLDVSLVGDDGAVAWRRTCETRAVPCGEVARIGACEASFPAADAPKRYFLRASFAAGPVKAENEWEMYAFPGVAAGAEPPASVRIAGDISRDELVAAMERGEGVLVFGAKPFKSLPTTFRSACAGRCSGQFATVVKKGHPALAGLPHDGFCGWQFRRLMENGRAVQLEAGVPFDPEIEVVASDKYPIRQAALFEYRVGGGRLLVCSFNFKDGDPASAWLRDRLVRYASSDAFRPALSMTVDQLRAVIDAPLLTGSERNENRANNVNDPSSLVREGRYAEP